MNKAKETISPTYCLCGRGYVVNLFQGATGKPVQVELVHSVLQGAGECKFAVHLGDLT